MTNQELRHLARAWQMSTGDEPNITTADCIIRLLDEHQDMKDALKHGRSVLNSLKDDES